jgi:DNA helicase-2/ATP-dependent DNA helicase PcrA
MATDLIKELNEVQRQAVQHTEGPVMIIAGAGSGKTRVLTYRLAYIIQQRKADAFELLALTFTNKAAREMRNRIEQLVGGDARNIFMGTFHAIFSRILRIEADKIGFTSSFTIYDEDDAVSLIKTIIKELQLDDKKYKPKSIKNNISGAKNKLIDPKTYLATYATDDFTNVVAQIYPIYQGRMQKANAMDFDDLLVYTAVLFKSNPQVLEKYQRRFKYILVDEYQDTNHAQYVITRALASGHHNICVVGDDAQSIYSFRGATIENILNFQKHYPNTKVFKLEQNYRSTGTIVNAANQVIKENKDQLQKEVFTKNPDGDLIRLIRAENELQEGEKIVDTIREQKQRHSYYNRDFAVLYRTNAQSRTIEDALRKAGIPYKVFGGLSFYKRKEIKDVVAYLRLAVNPNDEEALKRVINYPARAIGETSISKILALANENKVTAWDIVRNIMLYNIGRSAKAINDFATLILSFQKPTKPLCTSPSFPAFSRNYTVRIRSKAFHGGRIFRNLSMLPVNLWTIPHGKIKPYRLS